MFKTLAVAATLAMTLPTLGFANSINGPFTLWEETFEDDLDYRYGYGIGGHLTSRTQETFEEFNFDDGSGRFPLPLPLTHNKVRFKGEYAARYDGGQGYEDLIADRPLTYGGIQPGRHFVGAGSRETDSFCFVITCLNTEYNTNADWTFYSLNDHGGTALVDGILRYSVEFTAVTSGPSIRNPEILPLEIALWATDRRTQSRTGNRITHLQTFSIMPMLEDDFYESLLRDVREPTFTVSMDLTPEQAGFVPELYPEGVPIFSHSLDVGFAIRPQQNDASSVRMARLALQTIPNTIAPVPLPAGFVLLVTGLGVLAAVSARRARRS